MVVMNNIKGGWEGPWAKYDKYVITNENARIYSHGIYAHILQI